MVRSAHDQHSIPPDGNVDAEQPAWREDFPIDWPKDQFVARRDFTKLLVLTSLAFTVGQFWILVENGLRKRKGKPPVRAIAKLADLPPGNVIPFSYPDAGEPCLLVRTGEQTFAAFSQKCTHLSCAVKPDLANGRFHCPCHNGVFDLASGRPLAGPPRRPLPRVTLQIRDGVIYATGVEVSTT